MAVKHPNGLHQVEYEIATLEKVNEHYNILRFWGQVDYPPNRYGDLFIFYYCYALENNHNKSIYMMLLLIFRFCVGFV